MKVTCGIDWSEKHHDVALVDAGGTLVARRRVTDDVTGWKALLELFAEVRLQPSRADPGRDRDRPRPAGRLPARHRPQGLCDQSAVGRPLPGASYRCLGPSPITR